MCIQLCCRCSTPLELSVGVETPTNMVEMVTRPSVQHEDRGVNLACLRYLKLIGKRALDMCINA